MKITNYAGMKNDRLGCQCWRKGFSPAHGNLVVRVFTERPLRRPSTLLVIATAFAASGLSRAVGLLARGAAVLLSFRSGTVALGVGAFSVFSSRHMDDPQSWDVLID